MARAGVEHDQQFVLVAREDLVPESGKQDAVITVVGLGIARLELPGAVVFVDVQGWLAPVGTAPYHIHTVPVEVVRKDLIEFVGRLVVENGLHAGRGVGRRGICHQGGHAVPLEERIGRPPVSVEREIRPPGRLPDHQDADVTAVGSDPCIGQRNLLPVAFPLGVVVTYGIDHIRPGHDQASDLGGVAVDPGPVLHVDQRHGQGERQRRTGTGQKASPAAVVYAPGKEVDARHDAQEKEIPHGIPGEEPGGFRIAGVEDVAHHLVRDEHLIGVDEIEAQGVADQGEGKEAFPHKAAQKEQQVIDEEIERQHHDDEPSGDHHAVEAPFEVVEHQPEEGPVVCHERKEAEHRGHTREAGLLFEESYH